MRCTWVVVVSVIGMAWLTTVAVGGDGAPADKALLVVKLPADAVLTIGTAGTAQTGPERWFLSPPLTSGKNYSYVLTATWTENAKEQKRSLTGYVSAGKRTVVDFLQADAGKSRTFEFTYAATIKSLPKDKTAKIWLPLPRTTKEQDVALVSEELPAKPQRGVDKTYGNAMYFLEAMPNDKGEIALRLVFKVTRREVMAGPQGFQPPAANENLARFLQADALVPLGGKALTLVKGKKLPADQVEEARLFYEAINNHMRYSKEGEGWGRGDADWACDSKFGNCTDFHSLFIALARAEKIPAKFEMGFSIPEKRGEGKIGGYHCWAWFLPKGKNWFPVDISEANRHPAMAEYYFGNLTEDRLQFTTGRDIELAPKQAGAPLNYFIYPYVEVEGQAVPADRIERAFSYRDVGS